jgi:hypothetical protein
MAPTRFKMHEHAIEVAGIVYTTILTRFLGYRSILWTCIDSTFCEIALRSISRHWRLSYRLNTETDYPFHLYNPFEKVQVIGEPSICQRLLPPHIQTPRSHYYSEEKDQPSPAE